MQIEKYTDRLKGLIQAAQALAQRNGHQQLSPLHMLKALLDDEERFAAHLIEACGANVATVEDALERELNKLPKIEGQGAGQLYLAPEMARVFDQAEKLSQKAGDSFVTVEYMLRRARGRAKRRGRHSQEGRRHGGQAQRGDRQCPQGAQGRDRLRRTRL